MDPEISQNSQAAFSEELRAADDTALVSRIIRAAGGIAVELSLLASP
jgi:hypothetical protein